MPPILKRLRKLSEAAKAPDLATLLEPYGTNEGEGPADPGVADSADPGVADGPEASGPDGES